jgi:GR25 family glycosyltransferase involved in LPS biosynthesis/predicted NAD-dependent protein-ADP-ribosyltransferase YbiA (DUF1768 family)
MYSNPNTSNKQMYQDPPITYYVIHMSKDDTRVENINESVTKLGHPIQNFEAVIGKNVNLKDLSGFDERLVDNFTTDAAKSKYKSLGEVGCYLSHFLLIKTIAESGDKIGYTVVFEDDLSIVIDNLQDKIVDSIKTIDNARRDFDLLYLGNLRRKHGQGDTNHGENLANDLFYPDKTKPIWGTHAYVVKNANARKIYERLLNMNLAIDNKYTQLVQYDDLTALLLSPTVVNQNTSFISTITGTHVYTGEDLHKSRPSRLEAEKPLVSKTPRGPYEKLTTKQLQEKFNEMTAVYLSGKPHIDAPDKGVAELEVKFGTRGVKRITKTDYDNVIARLTSLGFKSSDPTNMDGKYLLRMENQVLDQYTGAFKMSRVRVELEGLKTIQRYCSTQTIESVWYDVNIFTKNDVVYDGVNMSNLVFDDFNFSVSYKTEKEISKRGRHGAEIIEGWDNSKKTFRYINRVTYVKEGMPFKIDLSIVKTSTRIGRNYQLSTTLAESGVFVNPESYEIEIEVDNKKLDMFPLSFDTMTPQFLQSSLRKTIKYVLSGLQETAYPISYTEQRDVLSEYMAMIHATDASINLDKRIDSRDFIGPSPVTLLMKNIAPPNKNSNAINIRTGYVVTEKADGTRALLYISAIGKVYLITVSMKVIFTGAKIEEKALFNTILDGELILRDKHKKFYNTFAAFDVYFVNKIDVRRHYFVATGQEDPNKSRYRIMFNVVSALALKPVADIELVAPIKVICKRFLPLSPDASIFDGCNDLLNNIQEGGFEYETDGLIFTPVGLAVGTYEKGGNVKNGRVTWEAAFKWKPPEYNTIDFLVSVIKTPSGQDKVSTIYEGGLNTSKDSQSNQYKTLILRCGMDERNDIYLNPSQDIIDDKIPNFIEDMKQVYQPKQFYPTTPYDPNAGICKLLLQKDGNDVFQMFTKEGEVFDDNMIVEFSYETSDSNDSTFEKETEWRWVPLRVRHDKTGELRNGAKEYGNSYKTANSNWESIHNPITTEMISTGENVPEEIVDDEVYYNSTTSVTTTRGLRDFHNIYVKKRLISAVSKPGDTLIDLACGKAGDLSKWIDANLSFVYGIDVSQQNLENKVNGACARYLNSRKQYKQVPNALFVHGNSALNIRSGEAMYSEKGAEISRAIFGNGEKNVQKLGKGVARQFARGANGFNITSCQFAIHYFFENKETFFRFIQNVSECTKVGGYFIGTSYDGETLFNKLRRVPPGESIAVNSQNERKMWEVTKEYNQTTFEAEDSCLGYKINVFQESINKSFHEYLVNYTYLTRILETYGFRMLSKSEAKTFGFNEGAGMFQELFNAMTLESAYDRFKATEYDSALNMTANEKTISFLNRYFIYKKISNENAEKLTSMFLHKDPVEAENEMRDSAEIAEFASKEAEVEAEAKAIKEAEEKAKAMKATKEAKEAKEKSIKSVKKLGKKLALVPATETISTIDIDEATQTLNAEISEEFQITKEEIIDIPNKVKGTYDENTAFAFYSLSKDDPRPGSGASEKIPDNRKKEYDALHKILQWRKKLSNFWGAPFTLNGHQWRSVEHYYQGSKFKMSNPEFYYQFSLDSGSELSKDPSMAKQAGGKDTKHKYRSANIQLDEDFFRSGRSEEEMFRAQYAKFTQNEDLRAMLVATNDATLVHIMGRGKPNVIFYGLMYIRNLLKRN